MDKLDEPTQDEEKKGEGEPVGGSTTIENVKPMNEGEHTEQHGGKKDIAADVGNRLSGEGKGEQVGEGVASPQTPNPFDITNLTLEQRQSLLEQLDSTPHRELKKRKNPTIRMRRIDGNIVEDFQNAFLGLVDDPENNRKVERHLIPVKFMGSKDYTNVLYAAFINSDQIVCEVLKTRRETKEFVEGEVFSREKGKLVEMVRKVVISWFTIKLPDGETMEIEGRMANA